MINHLIYYKQETLMEHKRSSSSPAAGAVYGLGLIGAAVYFIGASTSFWGGVLGFLKAIVWPAFLVFEALQKLYM